MLSQLLRDYKEASCSASATGPSSSKEEDSKQPDVTNSEAATFVILEAEPQPAPDAEESEAAPFSIPEAEPEPVPPQPRFKDMGVQCDMPCGWVKDEPKTVTSVGKANRSKHSYDK